MAGLNSGLMFVYVLAAAFFTPFFKEVWEKKPEIEQAFHMEEPAGLDDSGEGTLEHPRSQRGHPLPPPRHESYHLKLDGYDMRILSRFVFVKRGRGPFCRPVDVLIRFCSR